MTWYYVEHGERKGPLEEAQFQQLADAGVIAPETLVWREGFANWQAYRTTLESAVLDPLQHNLEQTPASTAAYCSHCGAAFPEEEMLCYEGAYVCATCKPAFFQKLKEGVRLPSAPRYAGFRIRFGAKLIDGIIIWVMQMAIALLIGLLTLRNPSISAATAIQVLLVLAQALVGATYSCAFLVKYGATPGKMACRLKVVTRDGGPINFGRAVGRYFAEMVSAIILFIGYVMVGFDAEKRALHDRICDTRVIRV